MTTLINCVVLICTYNDKIFPVTAPLLETPGPPKVVLESAGPLLRSLVQIKFTEEFLVNLQTISVR